MKYIFALIMVLMLTGPGYALDVTYGPNCGLLRFENLEEGYNFSSSGLAAGFEFNWDICKHISLGLDYDYYGDRLDDIRYDVITTDDSGNNPAVTGYADIKAVLLSLSPMVKISPVNNEKLNVYISIGYSYSRYDYFLDQYTLNGDFTQQDNLYPNNMQYHQFMKYKIGASYRVYKNIWLNGTADLHYVFNELHHSYRLGLLFKEKGLSINK